MRSVGRSSRGGFAKDCWPYRQLTILSLKESTGGIETEIICEGCKLKITVPRSGAAAFGKEVSGQPSQSGALFMSIDEEVVSGLEVSALSLAQIETQATNNHKKHIGSSAAMALLISERLINIIKIIHTLSALRYSESNQISLGVPKACL